MDRVRDVEQHRQVRVRVGFVLLDVVAVRPRVEAPVDAADVVAGDVAAVLREVDRGAEERRAVHAVDESLDDRTREQFEAADAPQNLGIDESRAGDLLACVHIARLKPSRYFSLGRETRATFLISASPPRTTTRR